jgi:hypothetical protein
MRLLPVELAPEMLGLFIGMILFVCVFAWWISRTEKKRKHPSAHPTANDRRHRLKHATIRNGKR